MDALLARAGCPWYAELLRDADVDETSLRVAEGGGADLLVAAGVEAKHAAAVLALLAAQPAAGAAAAAVPAPAQPGPASTRGGLYCPAFLAAVAPLYAQRMGCENMGPLLYSLVRFTKA